MTKADIIRMTAEVSGDGSVDELTGDAIERFANLAAAEAIEAMIPKLADLWDVKVDAICFDDMRREAATFRAGAAA